MYENPREATGLRAGERRGGEGVAALERDGARGVLDAVINDPLLPGRILPPDYLGQQAWRRRVEVLRAANRQLRTFKPDKSDAGRT